MVIATQLLIWDLQVWDNIHTMVGDVGIITKS